jgi:PleD family two-component response regulator
MLRQEPATIFVAGDDRLARDLVASLLQFEGYHVVKPSNRELALVQMADVSPDLAP